jgi:uncharacterized protein YbjT (DUF2867 family)
MEDNMITVIKHEGINGDSVAPDLAVPMIATRDIADVAAKALKARDWEGVVVRELLGPRDLTYFEATRILGERIGKPDLNYIQFSYAEMAQALVQAGLSKSFAGLYVDDTLFQRAEGQAERGPKARERHAHAVRGLRGRAGRRLPCGVRQERRRWRYKRVRFSR